MKAKITHQLIKDMCGVTSFKRGNAFFLANKVKIEDYDEHICQAIVEGTENFNVTISEMDKGGIQSTCSCPKLASFDKDCQHIAAVLLYLYDQQRNGNSLQKPDDTMTKDLFSLFSHQPIRSSSHQRHFENRQVIEAEFICKPVTDENGVNLLGIEVKLNSFLVENLFGFLEHLQAGKSIQLSNSFLFDATYHCFQREDDDVFQQMIGMMLDKKADKTIGSHTHTSMLLIPPTSWEKMLTSLLAAPQVKLVYKETRFNGIHVTKESLPLQFNFDKTTGYELEMKGLDKIVIFHSYQTVLYNGKFIQLDNDDFKRLFELNQMLKKTRTSSIPIQHEQVGFFLEKVVPGLKRLGKVNIAEAISRQLVKTPLVAKLYLDRIKNRLLAGLEFHYENMMINPLEGRDLPKGSILLRDIEKEEEILSLMEESSFSKTDGGYYLHNEELEYDFLYYQMPKLQKLCQTYATTAVRMRIFRENVKPQIRIKVKKERTNWLEFKFEMDGIAEKEIKEVLVALEEKRKYYRLRDGSLLSLETKEFEEIQRFLHTPLVQEKDLSNGLDLPIEKSLQLLDVVEGSESFYVEESFRQFLNTIHHPGSLDFPIPDHLDSILKDYQKIGFKWMKTLATFGFGGILADDMGLGKTLQSITFISSELQTIRQEKCPVLIVCPSSLTYNWLSEFMKFTPGIKTLIMDGAKSERAKRQNEACDTDVIITSYPLLRKDIKWYEKQTFHSIFFDEAQAFKNPLTQTARAVKKLKANHRFALTGTPVENSLEELWSIFHVVFPELFLGLKEYSQLTKATISRRIQPFLLRRMKEDVLPEFPDKVELTDSVELLPEQKKLYAAYLAKLRHDTLKHLDKETIRKNRIRILAGLTRLRQICCHPRLFVDSYKGSSAKFEQLMQIIEESRLSGRRVLIFSQFTRMLELIGRELTIRGLPYFYLDGQTPSEDRVEICNRYNDGERDYFLISLKAGGTGLNLMSADTVILYDTWWNPAVEEQAADRAHRIGQKNSVQVIKLVAKGTIEEKINELQDKKRDLIEEIIKSDGQKGTMLTEEDIREILML